MYLVRYRNEFYVEPEIVFRALYGFIGMMIGSLAYDRKNKLTKLNKGLWFLFASIFCCCGFLGMKLSMSHIVIAIKLQFMTQVFGVGFAVFSLLTGLCYEKKIQTFMKTIPGKLFGVISTCSLEIYLVQFAIIDYIRSVAFPANLLLILVTIIVVAWIIHITSESIYKNINQLLQFKR